MLSLFNGQQVCMSAYIYCLFSTVGDVVPPADSFIVGADDVLFVLADESKRLDFLERGGLSQSEGEGREGEKSLFGHMVARARQALFGRLLGVESAQELRELQNSAREREKEREQTRFTRMHPSSLIPHP